MQRIHRQTELYDKLQVRDVHHFHPDQYIRGTLPFHDAVSYLNHPAGLWQAIVELTIIDATHDDALC